MAFNNGAAWRHPTSPAVTSMRSIIRFGRLAAACCCPYTMVLKCDGTDVSAVGRLSPTGPARSGRPDGRLWRNPPPLRNRMADYAVLIRTTAGYAQPILRAEAIGTDVAAGRCARRKDRICRTASGIRSLGSFQGNMLTSAFGASIAASIATA